MRKSSRLWWLHGAILLSAMVGCNRNCTNSGGCGPGAGGSPYGPPIAGATGSVGPTISSMSTSPYTGTTGTTGAMPGMTSPAGSPFSTSANGFTPPTTSSSLGGGNMRY